MDNVRIIIVIPAFNEADNISKVLTELSVSIDLRNVLVVDDSSSDSTASLAAREGAEVLSLKENAGYAKAIEAGLFYAIENLSATHLLTMDADGQHDITSVLAIIEYIRVSSGEVDVVAGNRNGYARPSEWLFGLYYVLKFGVKDPLCGLKAYRSSLVLEYGAFEYFDSIGSELLTYSLIKKMRVVERDVRIRRREGESRFGSGVLVNLRILKALINSIKMIRKKNG